jgi:flagellar basal body-associated protein FliL
LKPIPRYSGDVRDPRGGIRRIKKSIVPYLEDGGRVEKVYNKLVRDRIPEIIQASGKNACIRKADEAEYKHLLRQKLLEEINEFMESGSSEELADIRFLI